jgi:hypothetical protein
MPRPSGRRRKRRQKRFSRRLRHGRDERLAVNGASIRVVWCDKHATIEIIGGKVKRQPDTPPAKMT